MKIIIDGTPEELKELFKSNVLKKIVDNDGDNKAEITGTKDNEKTSGTESIKGTDNDAEITGTKENIKTAGTESTKEMEDNEEFNEDIMKIATAMLLFPRLHKTFEEVLKGETK